MNIIVDDELYEAFWEVMLEDLGVVVVPRDVYEKMWEED